MEDAKPWWASKSIWAGIAGAAATVCTALGVHVLDDPAAQAELVGAATAVAAIVLRFVTKTPVK